jgi:hypothetical protein
MDITTRGPTSYPSATARSRRSPSQPSSSAVASAAGTTAQPGCERDALCESSVSSEWAIMPLTSAASGALQVSVDAITVARPPPACDLAYPAAAWPGASCEPETIAASVSSRWCFVCSSAAAC